MNDMKSETELVREEYEQALRRHDWYYQYSDDRNSYRAGVASAGKISALRSRYEKLAGKEAADHLYAKYSK